MATNWAGCGPALVTPFTEAGDLDEAAVTRLARRQVDGGVHFLVPCGTTGESPTLAHAEKIRVVELVARAADGRVPVLAGAGGYDTRASAELAADMARAGANGILSVTPYYNKPTPDGLFLHYATIAEATELPIIVYNVPSRTGCNVTPATLRRLAEIPNVVGVKEASGDLGQMCEICQTMADDFSVLSGDDAFTLALMALGGRGVISVVSNETPDEMAALVDRAAAGDYAEARAIHNRLLPLMQVNFVESNPIPVKAALAEMGLIDTATYRSPMAPPRPESHERIIGVLKGLGLVQ
ncbi:MAG: 4-hydroxy-tetrahydrodipicolinate synthase [Acidobacteria bacterium]|nr:4-hydroxy-tetrahydrodipicolinate synthase [Acidobacteriota bacterium]